ncbi:hypothetical protein AGMMS49921_11660 [Endomicrobiia bacterium]|nr:hypothetical protein AGMMS49921_11660 [Endomicrobiia bacterium]
MKLYTVNSKKHRSLKAICAVIIFGLALCSCKECPIHWRNHNEDQKLKSPQKLPHLTLDSIANIKLYTDGESYCRYQVGDSNIYVLEAVQGGGWRVSSQERKKLQKDTLYILVFKKKVSKPEIIMAAILSKRTNDSAAGDFVADFLIFRRSSTNLDNNNDEWKLDLDSGTFHPKFPRPSNLSSNSSK